LAHASNFFLGAYLGVLGALAAPSPRSTRVKTR
jgi:hypothetical protein